MTDGSQWVELNGYRRMGIKARDASAKIRSANGTWDDRSGWTRQIGLSPVWRALTIHWIHKIGPASTSGLSHWIGLEMQTRLESPQHLVCFFGLLFFSNWLFAIRLQMTKNDPTSHTKSRSATSLTQDDGWPDNRWNSMDGSYTLLSGCMCLTLYLNIVFAWLFDNRYASCATPYLLLI